MIATKKEPFPKQKAEGIAVLMRKPEFHALLESISARANFATLEATKLAQQTGQYPKFTDSALAVLKDATRYEACLSVLAEMQSASDHYSVVITQHISENS